MASLEPSTPVRPQTRSAWEQLRQEGDTPSVRKVYDLVGGTYNTVAYECKMLRAELAPEPPPLAADPGERETPPGDDAAPGDETPDGEEDPLPLAATGATLVNDLPDHVKLERHLTEAQAAVAQDADADDDLPSTADPPLAPPPLAALTQRVERLEQQLAALEDIRQLWQHCVRDPRTWKCLVLWSQRTVGQTRSPLTALVERLAQLAHPE